MVDTDIDEWRQGVGLLDGVMDWIGCEEAIQALLTEHKKGKFSLLDASQGTLRGHKNALRPSRFERCNRVHLPVTQRPQRGSAGSWRMSIGRDEQMPDQRPH